MRTNGNRVNGLWLNWNDWICNNFISIVFGARVVYKRDKAQNHFPLQPWFVSYLSNLNIRHNSVFHRRCFSFWPNKPVNGFLICGNYELLDNSSFVVAVVAVLLCSLNFKLTCVCLFSYLSFYLNSCLRWEWREKKNQKHAQTIPYDNYYCGQSLINERKSTNSLTQTKKKEEQQENRL